MTVYCFRCGATINNVGDVCPYCKRKTEFVSFYPTLRSRRDLSYVTEEGEKSYGYI